MCGIAGYFSDQPFRAEILQRMNERIRHRGPDGEGYVWLGPGTAMPSAGKDTPRNCIGSAFNWLPQTGDQVKLSEAYGGFAHRRLAIIDLEAGGHQPMSSHDQRYWITYNGEIYNYQEIREILSRAGFSFMTRSDTEVILAAWQHWGTDCLQYFNGMFAFAIYDIRNEILFAARDRFGVKPFYYYHDKHFFSFASEQKSLLQHPQVKTALNKAAVFDYFVFAQLEFQPESFFKNILELPAAHYLQWNRRSGEIHTTRYYHLKFQQGFTHWNQQAFNESVSQTRHLLEEAIRLRLRADVEVGTCLSGGLDSSAIAGFMRKIAGPDKTIKTFTAVFPGKAVDEGNWAREMASYINAEQFSVEPDAEGLKADLDELSLCQDIPIWSTSTYAQFRVMKLAAASGIKVVLDGQGGDEVFAGYGQHPYFYMKGLPWHQKLKTLRSLEKLKFSVRQYLRYDLIYKLPSSVAAELFLRYFPDLNLLNPAFYKLYRERFLDMRSTVFNDLNSRLAWEMDNTTLKAYLKCEDRCAMWFGVESRTPFADDHHLIEYVSALPPKYKIHNGWGKYLLRETLEGIVPEKIRLRTDKMGYATPNNAWVREIAATMKDNLERLPADIFNQQALRKNFSDYLIPKGDLDNGRIFKFYSFARWFSLFRQHFDG
jgi:asparagine synthase (glutamine-hydrolysing)